MPRSRLWTLGSKPKGKRGKPNSTPFIRLTSTDDPRLSESWRMKDGNACLSPALLEAAESAEKEKDFFLRGGFKGGLNSECSATSTLLTRRLLKFCKENVL